MYGLLSSLILISISPMAMALGSSDTFENMDRLPARDLVNFADMMPDFKKKNNKIDDLTCAAACSDQGCIVNDCSERFDSLDSFLEGSGEDLGCVWSCQ